MQLNIFMCLAIQRCIQIINYNLAVANLLVCSWKKTDLSGFMGFKRESQPQNLLQCVCLSMSQTFDLGALMTDATRKTEFDITYTIFQALKAGS